MNPSYIQASAFTPKTSNIAPKKHDGSSARRKSCLQHSPKYSEKPTPTDLDMSFCNDETPNKSNSLVVKAYGKSINEEKVKITHEELLKFRGGSAGGQSEPVVESPCKEELKCLLKETKNRLRAKSDGFDIVYTQWQMTQKKLQAKEESESNLKLRLEVAEKSMQDKDDEIHNLQFRLSLSEATIEKKHCSPALIRIRNPLKNHLSPKSSMALQTFNDAFAKDSQIVQSPKEQRRLALVEVDASQGTKKMANMMFLLRALRKPRIGFEDSFNDSYIKEDDRSVVPSVSNMGRNDNRPASLGSFFGRTAKKVSAKPKDK